MTHNLYLNFGNFGFRNTQNMKLAWNSIENGMKNHTRLLVFPVQVHTKTPMSQICLAFFVVINDNLCSHIFHKNIFAFGGMINISFILIDISCTTTLMIS